MAENQVTGVITAPSGNASNTLQHPSKETPSRIAGNEPTMNQEPDVTENTPVKSKWKTAYEEARHLAGGLFQHPVESTKHYSILRHSSGLVYYQGDQTNVTFSIFSDKALPSDRKYWLQSRGWSGKTGTTIGSAGASIGLHSNWIDVTPQVRVDAAQIKPPDERAWQRDITQFLRKARRGNTKGHKLRETVGLRVPAEARDGYFYVNLSSSSVGWSKKFKVLCSSPVFRVASLSTSASSVRGSSLGTLPLEVGVKALSLAGSIATGNALQPVTSSISQATGPYQTEVTAAEYAGEAAYTMSPIEKGVQSQQEAYDRDIQANYAQKGGDNNSSTIEGNSSDPSGPQAPYPIRFTSKATASDSSTVLLTSAPADIFRSLSGIFSAWAKATPKSPSKGKEPSLQPEGIDAWHPAVLIAYQDMTKGVKVTMNKSVALHLIHDIEDLNVDGYTLEVLVMGFIRPYESESTPTSASISPATPKTQSPSNFQPSPISPISQTSQSMDLPSMIISPEDLKTTAITLSQPAWSAEEIELAMTSSRTWSDKLAQGRQTAQRQVDKMNIQRTGIRRQTDQVKQVASGPGGYYIVR